MKKTDPNTRILRYLDCIQKEPFAQQQALDYYYKTHKAGGNVRYPEEII